MNKDKEVDIYLIVSVIIKKRLQVDNITDTRIVFRKAIEKYHNECGKRSKQHIEAEDNISFIAKDIVMTGKQVVAIQVREVEEPVQLKKIFNDGILESMEKSHIEGAKMCDFQCTKQSINLYTDSKGNAKAKRMRFDNIHSD